eukprot:GHVR01182674.1.p1 GENE.GHVR01182674.1~~GHVR01182674.1.p1  ORF type:complete len:112 (+),score=4.82 GHVR01182674.1:2296-2631(+)
MYKKGKSFGSFFPNEVNEKMYQTFQQKFVDSNYHKEAQEFPNMSSFIYAAAEAPFTPEKGFVITSSVPTKSNSTNALTNNCYANRPNYQSKPFKLTLKLGFLHQKDSISKI